MKIAWRVRKAYAGAFLPCTCSEHPKVIVHADNVAECPKCDGLVTADQLEGIDYELKGTRRGGGLWVATGK